MAPVREHGNTGLFRQASSSGIAQSESRSSYFAIVQRMDYLTLSMMHHDINESRYISLKDILSVSYYLIGNDARYSSIECQQRGASMNPTIL